MSRKHKLPDCECIVDAHERYVSMCPAHAAAWREVHERWAAERWAADGRPPPLLEVAEDKLSA